MPDSCCVPGCRSNYTCAKEKEAVSIFRFPKNQEKKQLWLRKIARKNFVPGKYAKVCAKHFSEQFIIRVDTVKRPDGSVLSVKRIHPKLTDDAFPSIFPKCPRYLKRKKPQEWRFEADQSGEYLFREWLELDKIKSFYDFCSDFQKYIGEKWIANSCKDYVCFYFIPDEIRWKGNLSPPKHESAIQIDSQCSVDVFTGNKDYKYRNTKHNWPYPWVMDAVVFSDMPHINTNSGSEYPSDATSLPTEPDQPSSASKPTSANAVDGKRQCIWDLLKVEWKSGELCQFLSSRKPQSSLAVDVNHNNRNESSEANVQFETNSEYLRLPVKLKIQSQIPQEQDDVGPVPVALFINTANASYQSENGIEDWDTVNSGIEQERSDGNENEIEDCNTLHSGIKQETFKDNENEVEDCNTLNSGTKQETFGDNENECEDCNTLNSRIKQETFDENEIVDCHTINSGIKQETFDDDENEIEDCDTVNSGIKRETSDDNDEPCSNVSQDREDIEPQTSLSENEKRAKEGRGALCVILNCSNRRTRRTTASSRRNNAITFHHLPHYQFLRDVWLTATNTGDFSPELNWQICSDHFKATDFTWNRGRRRLKKTAVPSIFNPSV